MSPLQRVQLQPRLPDALLDGCYTRTEQRGVHLLLKAVSAEQQQVVDRDLSSTAILFRLYIRHQPGGPGEKNHLAGSVDHFAEVVFNARAGYLIANMAKALCSRT